MSATNSAHRPNHEWDGPVTNPSIAKPGMYVCRLCKMTSPRPTDQPCFDTESLALLEQMRVARSQNPEAWRVEIDLDDAFLNWLFDPETKPAAQADAVDSLSANAARALLHRICYERALERFRTSQGGAA